MAFGRPDTSNPSSSNPAAEENSGDNIAALFSGGAESEDDAGMHPIGVHPVTTSLKLSKSREWLIFRLDVSDGPFEGEDVAVMRKVTGCCEGAKQKKQSRQAGMQMATIFRTLGLEVNPVTCLPAEGIDAANGIDCFAAITTWGDQCNTQLVRGVAKSRKVQGAEVGFPDSLRNEDGQHRNYGCGVSLDPWT